MSSPARDIRGLLVDTSVCLKQREWANLCELAKQTDRPVFISAITHGEMLRRLRTQLRARFAREKVHERLNGMGVVILPVDESVAECFAERIHERFPTGDKWNRAKQRRCHAMLRLGAKAPLEDINPEHHCSATSDWFIAATAAAHELIMVTEDEGEEFLICERMTLREAVSILEADEPPREPEAP